MRHTQGPRERVKESREGGREVGRR
jgi:hypothetical protein